MDKELEQFYKDIEIIEKVDQNLAIKLLAKFHVEVKPILEINSK